MHSVYVSSTLYSFRTKGSLSFSSTDYSCLLNERFGKNPFQIASSSSSGSCCSSCDEYSIHRRFPINPTFLYGLRQSTFLHCSPSRRLVLVGSDRFYYRLPVYTRLDTGCYETPYYVRGRRTICGRSGKRRDGRCSCMISEGKNDVHRLSGFNDHGDNVEEVLSFLSEEVGEECFKGRERRSSFTKSGLEIKGSLISSERVESEQRASNSGIKRNISSYERRRKNKRFGISGSKLDRKVELVKIDLGEEYRQNEGREVHLKGQNLRRRKEGSSCSSYYSFSPSEDNSESDSEIYEKQGGQWKFVGESSSGYGKQLDMSEEGRANEKVVLGHERYGNEKKVNQDGKNLENVRISEVSMTNQSGYEKASSSLGSHNKFSYKELDEERRKQSDLFDIEGKFHKITEIPQKPKNLVREVSMSDQSGYGKASSSSSLSSHNMVSYKELEEERRKQSVLSETKGKYHKITEIPQKPKKLVREVSTSNQICYKELEEERRNQSVLSETEGKYHKITEISQKPKKLVREVSTSDQIGYEQAPSSYSSSYKKFSYKELDEERGKQSLLSETKGKYQKIMEIPEVHETGVGKTSQPEKRNMGGQVHVEIENKRIYDSTVNREERKNYSIEDILVIRDGNTGKTRVKNHEQKLNMVSPSLPEAIDLHSMTDIRVSKRIESRKGSQDISLIHTAYKEVVTNTEKKITNEKRNAKILVEKPVMEARKPSQRPSEEESSNQASSRFVSQARVQEIDAEEEDDIRSQAMLIPPQSQFIARHPSHVEVTELTSRVETQEASGRMSESSGSGEKCWEPEEDVMGSVNRLENSSSRIVGEFIEQAVIDEGLTSEIQKEEEEVPKGPSDDLWHVMVPPSVQQTNQLEGPKRIEKTENVVVKRSRRSLWNVISGMVRLGWGSNTETAPSSDVKSGGKVSSNESVSSDAWFSGREHEDHENGRKKGRALTEESASSGRLESGRNAAQIPEVSDKTRSTNKRVFHKGDTSSSLEEKTGFNGDGERILQVASSGSEIAKSSLPLRAQELRSPTIKGISNTGIQKVYSGSELVQSSSPSYAQELRRSPTVEGRSKTSRTNVSSSSERLPELVASHEAKEGELKQRKLQRTKQVERDRLEEWEEASTIETEQWKIDEMFMREALQESKKAADAWEVPVGAVLVQHGKIIARGFNLVEELRDSTAHAELICIREASKQLRTWRLAETTLYVTLEPCPMCAGAIYQARIDTVVWGAPNKLLGADGSWIKLFPDGGEGSGSEQSVKPAAPVHPFHPKIKVRRGVLAAECSDAMQQFFQLRRKKVKKEKGDPSSSPTPPNPNSFIPSRHQPIKFFTKMHNIFYIIFCL